MSFILRSIYVLVGAAFLFAVANLFVSGVPDTQSTGIEIAALSPQQSPTDAIATDVPQLVQPGEEPGIVASLLALLVGTVAPEAATTPTPVAVSFAPSNGDATLPTTAPLYANGDAPKAREEAAAAPIDDAAIEQIFQSWLRENEIEAGAIAIIHPDGTEFGTGLGRTADDLHPVMSLSKAITGLCVDQLLLEAGLGWGATLADIAPQMSAAGVTPRPWNEHITLASLVTHTSGLSPDLTQSNMVEDTHGALGLHRRWGSAALQEDAITGAPGRYFYSNTNYAVLGVVAEALSGQSYAQACMDRILAPAGIETAVIEGRYGSLSSYGGWEVSAMDYARLARHWFAHDQPHMASPRPDFDGYVLGYFDDGSTISHSGRFCSTNHPTGGLGAIFLTIRDGATISANWDACVEASQRDTLVQQLREHL